jgi:hypothetical protein
MPDFSGEKQETRCRDPIFALLLYANVAAIAGVAVTYGPGAFDDTNDNSTEYDGYIYATIICVLASFVFSAGAVLVMMAIPETLIKVSLIFVTVMAGVWCVMSFVSGAIGVGVLGAIFFAVSVCYAWAVWSRIPFATANLVTAITAIRANIAVVLIAYVLTLLAAGWSILWGFAFVGVFDQTYGCDENNVCDNVNYGFLFLLFVAYFFTHQVLQVNKVDLCIYVYIQVDNRIVRGQSLTHSLLYRYYTNVQNSVHVTVAGTVGNWWFEPEESGGCCATAVNNSFIRTMTTSFGSVCFGSLIVAIIQALRMVANQAQASGDGGIGACIAECFLSCLASIVEVCTRRRMLRTMIARYPSILWTPSHPLSLLLLLSFVSNPFRCAVFQ